MGFDRRMLGLLVLLGIVGIPALALRLLCVGHACDEPVAVSADIPFCSLPEDVRRPIAAGFREGRSPDVLGVTGPVTVAGGDAFDGGDPQPQWPSEPGVPRRVPLLVAADGLEGAIPGGTELDDLAPTIAEAMGIERPHPEVRSGRAIEGIALQRPARLVVQVVWKGVGSEELEARPQAWPKLAQMRDDGIFSLDVRSPSLPLDPAAVLTTIGSGGIPAQHGITGSLVRTDQGRLVEAWGRGAPVSVIAALGDDLDELTDQQARVGLIAHAATDRGLIGADWYVRTDRDEVTVEPGLGRVAGQVRRVLHPGYLAGYGADEVPDLLAVTLQGPMRKMDAVTARIAEAVSRVEDTMIVVTATGSSIGSADLNAGEVSQQVEGALGTPRPVVEATAPGGLFLDQGVLGAAEISEDEVLSALESTTGSDSRRVFADTFPAFAVSFARYC